MNCNLPSLIKLTNCFYNKLYVLQAWHSINNEMFAQVVFQEFGVSCSLARVPTEQEWLRPPTGHVLSVPLVTFWYQKTLNSTFRTGWHSPFPNTCPMKKQVLTTWLHLCRTDSPSPFSSLQSPFSHIPHVSDHPVSLSHKCPKVDLRIVLPPPRLAAWWINPFSLQTLVSQHLARWAWGKQTGFRNKFLPCQSLSFSFLLSLTLIFFLTPTSRL